MFRRPIILTVAIAAFFISVFYGQYMRIAKEQLAVKAQHYKNESEHHKNSEIAIRNQYKIINAVLLEREVKRDSAEKALEKLKEALKDAQKKSQCTREPVPDAVIKRLRERVEEVNHAASNP